MLYKIEKEYDDRCTPKIGYVVYERPFMNTKWRRDIAWVSMRAAKARIKHLKTFNTIIDWSVKYVEKGE